MIAASIRRSILILTIALAASTASWAADPAELFRQGDDAYQRGEWRQALAAYEAVLKAGFESGPLYYNLGNCHYKLKRLGQAVLFYEKARRLIPGDPDLEFNLSLAHERTVDKVIPLPRFWLLENLESILWALPRGALWWTGVLLYFSAVAALIVRILAMQPALHFRSGVLAAGLAGLGLLCGLLLVARAQLAARPEGVILAESTRAFSGPGEDNVQVFALHEGTKVGIEKRSGEWVEILLADGNVGWVRQDDLGEI